MDLSSIPAIDHHAHNLLRPERGTELPLAAAFTEASDPEMVARHGANTLCYRRSLRDIAALLNCEPIASVVESHWIEMGLTARTQHCWAAANLQAIYMDDGFLPDRILPLEWHQQFVPVSRLLRIEWLAEQMIQQVNHFEVFLEWFRSELNPPPKGVIGLKSIAAYRSGLDIEPVSLELAEDRFYFLKETNPDAPIRLTDKPLIDFLVQQALEIAAFYRLPVQFHCGFGDPDLDLRLANPLHLRPLLEDRRFRQVPIVLLHGAYPFMAEAGYLAGVYPQVHVDFGLAVPFLSVAGMRRTLQQLLELSPTSKILYSSDAHFIPELYYLGAKWGREVLGQVLDQAIQDGDLVASEAESIAHAILWQNAQTLYTQAL